MGPPTGKCLEPPFDKETTMQALDLNQRQAATTPKRTGLRGLLLLLVGVFALAGTAHAFWFVCLSLIHI